MAKLRSPFSTNTLLVTQTYHTQSNNTAVDFSAVADTPVYAVADGTVTYRSSGLGSYCIQHLDNSDLMVYYVHTYKWVGVNTHVKKGQIIARVAPTSVNGGHPTHLHLGLQVGRYLMDYMDRSLDIRAGFAWGSANNIAIRNAWFNGGSVFDWSKHKDLSYLSNTMSFKKGDRVEFTGSQNIRTGSGTTFPIQSSANIGDVATIIDGPRNANNYVWWDMRFDKGGTGWVADVGKWKIYTPPSPAPPVEPPPAVDPTLELKKRIDTLEKENEGLRIALGDSEDKNDLLTGQIEVLKAEVVEIKNTLLVVTKQKDEAEEKASYWQEKYSKLKLKLEQGQESFIEKIVDWVREVLAKILNR